MSQVDAVLNEVSDQRSDGSPDASRRAIQESLAALRALLRMEVAFVSRFAEGRRWFEFLDTDASFAPWEVGDSEPLEKTYCARVVDGRIPRIIPDTSGIPELRALPATCGLPVGSHVSVPVLGEDGEPRGTLCCFSRHVDLELRERDEQLLVVFARLIAGHMDLLVAHDRHAGRVQDAVGDVLTRGGPSIALQPVVEIATGRHAGYEALSRFPSVDALEGWAPDRWFREAEQVGLVTVPPPGVWWSS